MRKLLLGMAIGTAVATTLSSGVQAYTITSSVYSDITALQLWVGPVDIMTHEAPGSFNLAFGGSATDVDGDGYIDSANLLLYGLVDFTVNGLNIRLDFDLQDGGYAAGSGITFRGGTIGVEINTSSGWIPYSTIDASSTNLGFLANQPGHLAEDVPGQITAGIVRDTLPGLWDGVIGSASFNRGAGAFTLLGQMLGFYMQGTIGAFGILDPQPGEIGQLHFGPPQVPVPAAAWLFGSALAGFAGAVRLRRKSFS